MNPVLFQVSRAERRHLLNREAAARKRGVWGPWVTIPRQYAHPNGKGWLAECDVHKNDVFAVLSRWVWPVRHLAISSLSGERPTWWEAQRIKNELASEGATAVEVYPPQDEVVDGADMYHLWVLPEPLSFSLTATPPREEE